MSLSSQRPFPPPDGATHIGVLREHAVTLACAALASVLLSLWAFAVDDVINRDGIAYIEAAERLWQGVGARSAALTDAPAYPALIALVHGLTGSSYVRAAHLIGAVIDTLVVTAFLVLTARTGAPRRVMPAAAAVIVLFAGTNAQRAGVSPDAVFCLFYLLALIYLLKLLRDGQRNRRHGLLAAVCMLAASLFGIEGLILLTVTAAVLTPYLYRGRRRAAVAVLAFAAGGAGVVIVAGWWAFASAAGEAGGGPFAAAATGLEHIRSAVAARVDLVQTHLLGRDAGDYAYAALLFAALTVVAAELLARLSLVPVLVLSYAAHRRVPFADPAVTRGWLGLVAVLGGLSLLSSLLTLLPPSRFSQALALTVLVPVSFALVRLYEDLRRRSARPLLAIIGLPLLLAGLVVGGISALYSHGSERYLKEAGEFLARTLPPAARIYTDDALIAFYSDRGVEAHDYVEDPKRLIHVIYDAWHGNDYVAFNVRAGSAGRRELIKGYLHLEPTREFSNERGDYVMIYRTGD